MSKGTGGFGKDVGNRRQLRKPFPSDQVLMEFVISELQVVML